jgi:hypothetical protein
MPALKRQISDSGRGDPLPVGDPGNTVAAMQDPSMRTKIEQFDVDGLVELARQRLRPQLPSGGSARVSAADGLAELIILLLGIGLAFLLFHR